MQLILDGEEFGRATNVYCIGRNYADHAKELNNAVPSTPMVFLKSTGSLRMPDDGVFAFPDESVHHEAELVFLVGRDLDLNSKVDAHCLAGVGLGLDLTRREMQNQLKEKGHPWTLAKSFAGAGIIGPFIGSNKIDFSSEISFDLSVNGELRQSGNSRDMIFSVETILKYLISFTPLQRGDLIFTGTPKGVGPLKKGDRFKLAMQTTEYEFEGAL